MFVIELPTPSTPRGRERAINRREQGDIGEASAIEWLTSKGALVWVPLGHSPDVDLIAQFQGRLIRVQVKTTVLKVTTPKGQPRWNVSIATRGGNRSWSGETKQFDPDKVDYLFALVGDGRRWLIPAAMIRAKTQVTLGAPAWAPFEIEPGTALEERVYPGAAPSLELPVP